jgi:hypothetical protein
MYKNKLVLIFLGILFSVLLPAQVRYGYQISPSVNWLSSSSPVINTNGAILGVKSGLVFDIPVPAGQKFWFVSTGFMVHYNCGGVLSNQNPGKYWINSDLAITADTFPQKTKLKYKLTYIEIPVGLKIGNLDWFYFESYANIGFRRFAKGEISGTSNLNQRKILLKKEINYFNFSFGVGCAYNIGRSFLDNDKMGPFVGLFYEIGLADITKNKGSYQYSPTYGTVFENSKTVTNSILLRIALNLN